ncbi:MAG: NAD+ synthase [bacterium]|nr:NAD+ synthase [bacterium]
MTKGINFQDTLTTISRFLVGQLNLSSLFGYVVGLSGGIDSALSATLAVRAVGADKVFGVLMPYRTSSSESVSDARKLVNHLGIESKTVDISPMIDAYYETIDDDMRLRAGNKMARERMSILFDQAYEMNRLVLGTGNRTEICLGYTTLFGDSACSANPIGELYKAEVRDLARHLEVPESIITKAPSADLWADQTDEGEIGVTYDEIDGILRRVVDDGERSIAALESEGFNAVSLSRVISFLNRNAFKRSLPPVAPLNRKAVPNYVQLDS